MSDLTTEAVRWACSNSISGEKFDRWLAEIQAQALREAADAFDLDAAQYHATSRVAGVRCSRCNLRYEERDQYGCGEPGHGHEYDDAELLEAGELHIERTYDGDQLRDRAARLTATSGETATPVHVGGRVNAEDCPACSPAIDPPPYPWICPGPTTTEGPADA